MGALSNILGSAGAPTPLIMAGVTYQLSPLTKRKQDEVQQWLVERALVGASDMKRALKLDSATYASLLHKINQDVASGAYGFGGEEYQKAMGTFDGMVRMLWVMLKPNHADFEGTEGLDKLEELVENNIEDVQAAFERISAEIEEENQKKTKARG